MDIILIASMGCFNGWGIVMEKNPGNSESGRTNHANLIKCTCLFYFIFLLTNAFVLISAC